MFRAVRILVVVGLAAWLGACGTQTVDPASGESLVRKAIARAGSAPPTSDKCPSGVQAKAGTTFNCQATLPNGQKYIFTIRIDSVSGSHGHLTVVAVRRA